jgi:predicted transcriptional regulator
MTDRPEVRVSIRVEPDLYAELQRVAEDRYEGRLSMAAREAFRLLVSDQGKATEATHEAEKELAAA